MKAIEFHLPQEIDKSFTLFRERGKFFPAPWHYHDHYELCLVTKSSGKRMVGDNIGYFGDEDLVFMGSMLPHVWVNDQEYLNGEKGDEADALVIHFTRNFLGEQFMHIPEMESFRNVLKQSERGMAFYGTARSEINAIMKKMPGMNGLQRLSALVAIFDCMANTKDYELLASPKFMVNFHDGASDRFKKVTEYIMNNFDKDISLPEVAAVANMSLTAFCNFFKKQYRVTFVEYLSAVRLGHACKMLGEGNKSIIEVAYQCGYNNLANFNRQFKKFKNMTPSEYRKTLVIPMSIAHRQAI